MRSRLLAIAAAFGLVCLTVVPPEPAMADYSLVTASGTLTAATQAVTTTSLTGQSSCNVEVVSDTGLTLSFQAITQATWTPVFGTTPDNTSTVGSVTTAGTWIVNCASFQRFRVLASAGTGSAVVNVTSSGGVGRVLSSGVNGGKTIVAGSGPITVTNAGNTATVGLTAPLPILYGGTGATAIPSGCVQSNGTTLVTTGFACGSGSGIVTAVTGSGNIQSSGGTSPNVTITDSPTFGGALQAQYLKSPVLVPGDCVHAITGGQLASTTADCLVGVQAGTNVTITGSANNPVINAITPSPGPTPVTTVTGTTPIVSSGGATPAVSCPTCLIGLTAGSNIVVGTGTSPSVAVTSQPTFASYVTSPEYLAYNTSNGPVSFYSNSASTGGGAHDNENSIFINNAFNTYSATILGTSSATTIQGTPSTCLTIQELATNSSTYTPLFGADCSGNLLVSQGVKATSLLASGLTPGDCLQAGPSGLLTTAANACRSTSSVVTDIGYQVNSTAGIVGFAQLYQGLTDTVNSLWVNCFTTDNGTMVVSFVNGNNTVLGTVHMANGAYEGSISISPYTPTTQPQGLIYALVTTAGSALYCVSSLAGTRPLN